MELLADANHENLFVHLDTYHAHREEASFSQAVQLCGNRLGYVHIGESHRGYVGSKQVGTGSGCACDRVGRTHVPARRCCACFACMPSRPCCLLHCMRTARLGGWLQADFTRFFSALAAINHSGPLTFESFSSAVVSEDLSNLLCVWRNMWNESANLAAHARGFVDAHWRAARVAAAQARVQPLRAPAGGAS